MKRIAIFASGEGTNAERIIRYFKGNKAVEITLVVTNKEQAGVIRRAENLKVPAMYLPAKDFKEGKINEVMRQHQIDFIVLAGFLLHVPDSLLEDYPNRIINIHPSLLPKFGGKGMYGSRVHEAVLAAGEQESGITIHYVNEHYDQKQTLDELAKHFFVSRSTLIYNFKKYTNCSLIDFLLNVRLTKAKELLLNTKKSVNEISELCGFSSSNYFGLIFKKKENLSPANYRKHQKNKR